MSEKDPTLKAEVSTNDIGAEKPKTVEIEIPDAKNDQKENDAVTTENKCEDSSKDKKVKDVKDKKNVVEDSEHEVKEVASEKMKIGNNVKYDLKNENEKQEEGVVQDVNNLKIEHTEKEEKVDEMADVKKDADANETERKDMKTEEVREMEEVKDRNIVDGVEESEVKQTVGKFNELKEVIGEKEKCEEDKAMNEKDEENKENEEHEGRGEDEAMEESNDPEDEENKKNEGEAEVVKEMDEKEIEDDKDSKENSGENVRKRKRSGGRGAKKGASNESKEIKGKEELARTPTFKLERPQRERKTVERLVEVIEKGGSIKRLRIEKGNGTPLKDIPNVAYKLSEKKPDDIKSLHLILFGRKGKAIDFKNHISEFSGFVWHGDEDKQRMKVKEKLDKCIKEKLCDFCDVFDIRVSRTNTRKEDLVAKLLDFLVAPRATTDVLLEEKYQSSSRSGKRKRGARGSAPKSVGSSGRHSKKRWAKGEDDTPKSTRKNVSESESESEDEEHEEQTNDNHHSDANNSDSGKDDFSGKDADTGDDEDEESEKSSDEGKKLGRRKGMSGCTNTRKETTPVKVRSSATAKIPAKMSSLKKPNLEKINDSSEKVFSRKKKADEVPKKKSTSKMESKATNSGRRLGRGTAKTVKTKGSMPSKEELRKIICEILKDVDFNTATFTDILKRLADHFKTDLSQKKPAIKLMIQEELTKLAEAEDDGDEDDDEDDSGNDSDIKPSAGGKVKA